MLLGLSGLPAPLAAQAADTTGPGAPFFTANDAFLLVGFGAATAALAPVDKVLANYAQGDRLQKNVKLAGTSTAFRILGVPGAQIISAALYGAGRLAGNDGLARMGLHEFEALMVGGAATGAIKYLAGRARPYRDPDHPYDFQLGRGFESTDFQSFPSGHTTSAFAMAASTAAELSHWWPNGVWVAAPVLYFGAAAVGLSRMYDNKHWATDVMTGAAIGTFAGIKVVRYAYRHPDNRVETFFVGVTVVPGAGARPYVRVVRR